jgi:integration host factor subunit alpha
MLRDILMTGKNILRLDLAAAVYNEVSLSRTDAADLGGQVLEEISASLAVAANVKFSGFGVFTARDKAERVGRNPKNGEREPFEPRRSITFSASHGLKAHMNGSK